MPQSAAASFLDATLVFSRAQYAAAVGCGPDDPAVEAMLSRHAQAGEIKHVAEDVFGTIPEGCETPDRYPVPTFLVACWLRPGAVLAYHSALDLHGYAYASGCLVQAFTPGGWGEVVAGGRSYDFLEPAPGIVLGGDPPADGIEVVTFMDVDVRVTTLERTMADLFDRPEMGGDILVESLDFTDDLDGAALVRHMRALGNPAAAGALGFWLESRREEHGVDDATLRELRALAPRERRYALGAESGGGMLAGDWNVILPDEFVEPELNGVRWSEM